MKDYSLSKKQQKTNQLEDLGRRKMYKLTNTQCN